MKTTEHTSETRMKLKVRGTGSSQTAQWLKHLPPTMGPEATYTVDPQNPHSEGEP